MLEETRSRYELEKLWALGEEHDDQCREMKEELLEEDDLSSLAIAMGRSGHGSTAGGDGGETLVSKDCESSPSINEDEQVTMDSVNFTR